MPGGLTKGRRITGAERGTLSDQLRKEYEAGRSIRAIAEETGRSYGFVHRVLQESGATLRGRGGATRRVLLASFAVGVLGNGWGR